jgi:hypothetical protein
MEMETGKYGAWRFFVPHSVLILSRLYENEAGFGMGRRLNRIRGLCCVVFGSLELDMEER